MNTDNFVNHSGDCALCNKVGAATSTISFSSKSKLSHDHQAENILNNFVGGCGHEENCLWALCSNCADLCKKLSQTRQFLSAIVDDITNLLLRSHHKITFLLPKNRIITKLFEVENRVEEHPPEVLPFDLNADDLNQLCKNTNNSECKIDKEHNHVDATRDIVEEAIESSSFEGSNVQEESSLNIADVEILMRADAEHAPEKVVIPSNASASVSKNICLIINNTKKPIKKKSFASVTKISGKNKKSTVSIMMNANDGNTIANNKIKGKKTYACSLCTKSCRSPKDLDIHMGSHLQERKFICECCGIAYRHKRALEVHVALHRGEAMHRCPHCQKSFTQKAGLNRHLPIHTGEMAYQCEECGKRFLYHTSFAVHKLTHNGQRQYACDNCGLRFYSNSHLRRHLKSHIGIKPHKCPVCAKTFSEKYNLEAHMSTHTGLKKFMCPCCNIGFNRKQGLVQHISSVHNTDAKIEEM